MSRFFSRSGTQVPSPADLSRRTFLAGTLGGTALCLSGTASSAAIQIADLRGSMDAGELGLVPNASDDQTALFQNAINRAVEKGRALFLPAGNYPVANLRFPSGTLIVGVPGRTRLIYQGGGGLLATAEGVSNVSLSGLTFDGANRSIGGHTEGLLHFVGVRELSLTDSSIVGSAQSGVVADRCSGRISGCIITGAAEAAIR
ncbi:MAG: TIGR03808 family TAT-translocated repetitive protein, partial [Roseibium sp.]